MSYLTTSAIDKNRNSNDRLKALGIEKEQTHVNTS